MWNADPKLGWKAGPVVMMAVDNQTLTGGPLLIQVKHLISSRHTSLEISSLTTSPGPNHEAALTAGHTDCLQTDSS